MIFHQYSNCGLSVVVVAALSIQKFQRVLGDSAQLIWYDRGIAPLLSGPWFNRRAPFIAPADVPAMTSNIFSSSPI